MGVTIYPEQTPHMASAQSALLPYSRHSALLFSSSYSHKHLSFHSNPHFHPSISIPLSTSFLPSLLSDGPKKRVPRRRKAITISISCRIPGFPARDIVLEFGRYKGRMMGTLPSKYLRWMAKDPIELPTDEDWATLAKEVLKDPYYRDRLEWETIQDPLQNTRYPNKKKGNGTYNFLRLATRFGWDLTAPWKDIDFNLLGTSKGGRIPRVKDNPNPNLRHDYYLQKKAIIGSLARSLASGSTSSVAGKAESKNIDRGDDPNGYKAEILKRREARRERQRARGVGSNMPQLEQRPKGGAIFPGREALLKKLAESEAEADKHTPKWPKT